MKLDAVSAPKISSDIKIQPLKGGTIAMTEGDVTNARVIAAHDDMVSLKTPDGAVFRARLESGVSLPVGSEARLVVTGLQGGTIVMSLAPPGQTAAAAPQIQADQGVQAVLLRLAQMGATDASSAAVAAREILAALPGASPDEAAFLIANKLPPDGAVLDALRAALSGRSDTGALLDSLSRLASDAARDTARTSTPPETAAAPGTVKPPADGGGRNEIPKAVPGESPETAALPANKKSPEATPGGAGKPPAFTQWLARVLSAGEDLSGPTGRDLARSPFLEALPARSLAVMAESLGRIARSMPELPGEAELFKSIAKFAEELFLRPENTAGEAAEKLKAAREELYVKLAYFRDAAAASSAPSKGLVAEQAQKLLDHARLLGGLDQFVCVQLPVRLGDERSRADLYIYKKDKGGAKRIDPEDVRILLALDTAHMGRLETFIEIKGRDVSLRIEVESDDVASAFRQNTTKLHKLLDESGYKYANSNIITKKSETTLETALISLRNYETSVSGGLDVRV